MHSLEYTVYTQPIYYNGVFYPLMRAV